MRHLLGGSGTAARPLVRFIIREFETRASFGEWEFRVRRGSQPMLLNQAHWIEHGGLVIELPRLGDQPLRRIEVMDLDEARILADTAARNDDAVFDEHMGRLEIHEGIDLSKHRRLVVRGAVPPSSAEHLVVVRLWGDGDRLIETLPVVTPGTKQNARVRP